VTQPQGSRGGKTVLPGHGLVAEGMVAFDREGKSVSYWRRGTNEAHAMCRCGQLSPAGISMGAARRWHNAHKDEIRAASRVRQVGQQQ
jgi:hypothetical protein